MYNKNTVQPANLSVIEWSLLQHLSTLTDCFYQADAALGFTDTSSLFQVSNSLKFAQNFSRLKTAGYLLVIPMAFDRVTPNTRPLYTLTALGKKATHNDRFENFLSKQKSVLQWALLGCEPLQSILFLSFPWFRK